MPSASASNDVLCDAAGNVYVSHLAGNKIQLAVKGLGRCLGGDQRGPYIMTLSGVGSAKTLGPCGGLLPLVTSLNVPVHVHLSSVIYPAYTHDYDVTWQFPIASFPRISAFTMFQDGGLRGAGAVVTAKTACEGDQDSSGALFDFDFINGL
jgi:hypothetical protein